MLKVKCSVHDTFEGYSRNVLCTLHLILSVPDEGYSRNVPCTLHLTLSVPDEGYSRNVCSVQDTFLE
jgi:hypothetical protein